MKRSLAVLLLVIAAGLGAMKVSSADPTSREVEFAGIKLDSLWSSIKWDGRAPDPSMDFWKPASFEGLSGVLTIKTCGQMIESAVFTITYARQGMQPNESLGIRVVQDPYLEARGQLRTQYAVLTAAYGWEGSLMENSSLLQLNGQTRTLMVYCMDSTGKPAASSPDYCSMNVIGRLNTSPCGSE